MKVAELWRDFLISRALRKRGWKRRDNWLVERKSDSRMFAPGSPQDIGYAMRGLFTKGGYFHFYRVREWQGLLIASPKVFWIPRSASDFRLLYKAPRFDLSPWPEHIESAKIDQALAAATGTAKTAKLAECEASQSGPQGNARPTEAPHD